jgi:hypothetical protein
MSKKTNSSKTSGENKSISGQIKGKVPTMQKPPPPPPKKSSE